MLSKCREIQSGSTWSLPVSGYAMAVSLIGGRSPPEPLVTTKYESSGAMSPAKTRWMPPTKERLSSHSRVRHGSSALLAVPMRATP